MKIAMDDVLYWVQYLVGNYWYVIPVIVLFILLVFFFKGFSRHHFKSSSEFVKDYYKKPEKLDLNKTSWYDTEEGKKDFYTVKDTMGDGYSRRLLYEEVSDLRNRVQSFNEKMSESKFKVLPYDWYSKLFSRSILQSFTELEFQSSDQLKEVKAHCQDYFVMYLFFLLRTLPNAVEKLHKYEVENMTEVDLHLSEEGYLIFEHLSQLHPTPNKYYLRVRKTNIFNVDDVERAVDKLLEE